MMFEGAITVVHLETKGCPNMTNADKPPFQQAPPASRRAYGPVRLAVGIGVTGAIVGVALALAGVDFGAFLGGSQPRLKAPDFHRLADAGLLTQVHLAAALTALAIGTVLLLNRKGTRFHRTLGWGWVLAMATTALTSIFITDLGKGHWSVIHLLTGWVIIILPMAVFMARRKKVEVHKRMMTGLFVGGLLVAGAFTFLPGRLMWDVFLG
jgi:uncharacterized membrane protein